jgi:pyridoxamine 5'-phosphate oxidase
MIEEVSNYLNQIRHDFTKGELNESTVATNPLEQYANWFEEAVGAQVPDPKAMVVSTVNSEGKPSSRVVYSRGLNEKGMLFYTNYNSQKGDDLAANPNVCVNIYWPELERQIRLEGKVSKVSDAESDAYFASRPRDSQIGAWASEQSSVIENREALKNRVVEFEDKFKDQEVPRPPHWGGYIIEVTRAEFWQGRPARLHDRIVYSKTEDPGVWSLKRLSP